MGGLEHADPAPRDDEVSRLSRLYAALTRVNRVILRTPSRADLLDGICRALTDLGGFRMTWVGIADRATLAIVPVASAGDELGYLARIRVFLDGSPLGRGPAASTYREGRPHVLNDVWSDPTTVPWRAEAERSGFQAVAIFPIREGGEVTGILAVYDGHAGVFRDREVELLAEAADNISFALDNIAREDDRRAALEKLKSEKTFSETMIESMPGIVYVLDEEGRHLRWNSNFERVTGYPAGEIAAMRSGDFMPAAERAALAARIGETFARGESTMESEVVSRSGARTPYFFTGKRVLMEGRPCLVGVGIDISERKNAEIALRELNETLEERVATRTEELQAALVRAEAADRIKSAFVATMSHELRTPLNSIIGFTGILLQRLAGPLTPEQAKQLGMVRGSARHLLELINDVLDLARIEADQLRVATEPFAPAAMLERVVASLRPQAEAKGLRVTLAIPSPLGEVVSDPRRVEQIVLNLLTNAIKFTDEGDVWVTATLGDALLDGGGTGPAMRVVVADTGIGISPADLATLFRPFRQVDTGLSRHHEGTGLGLVICRRLAALLGGTISVTSEPSRGSTFTLALPLRRPEAP